MTVSVMEEERTDLTSASPCTKRARFETERRNPQRDTQEGTTTNLHGKEDTTPHTWIRIYEHDRGHGTYRVFGNQGKLVAQLNSSVNLSYEDEFSHSSVAFATIKHRHLGGILQLLLARKYSVQLLHKNSNEEPVRATPGDLAGLADWIPTTLSFDDTVTLTVAVPYRRKRGAASPCSSCLHTSVVALNTVSGILGVCTISEADDPSTGNARVFPETISLLTRINAAEIVVPDIRHDQQDREVNFDYGNILCNELSRQGFYANQTMSDAVITEGKQFLQKYVLTSSAGSMTELLCRNDHHSENNEYDMLTENDIEDLLVAVLVEYNKANTNSIHYNILHSKGFIHGSRLAHFDKLDCPLQSLFSLSVIDQTTGTAIGKRRRGQATTVLGFLNRCCSRGGSRLLRKWILQPCCVGDVLQYRHAISYYFSSHPSITHQLRQILTNLAQRDVQSIFASFGHSRRKPIHEEDSKVAVDTILTFLNICNDVMVQISSVCAHHELDELPYEVVTTLKDQVQSCSDELERLAYLKEQLRRMINNQRGNLKDFIVTPTLNSSLESCYAEIEELTGKLQHEAKHVAESLGLTYTSNESRSVLSLEFNDSIYGISLRAPKKYQSKVRALVQRTNSQADDSDVSILRQRVSSTSIFFQTGKLYLLSQQYLSQCQLFREKQHVVLMKARESINGEKEALTKLSDFVATMDVLTSFATIALESARPYCTPTVVPNGTELYLSSLRHPLMETWIEDGFVANSVRLADHPPSSVCGSSDSNSVSQPESTSTNIAVLAGPNCGGKSTLIQSIGIATYLAHIGCLVPAESAIIPLYHHLYLLRASTDKPLRGVSAYMDEVLEVSSCLRNIDNHSLVLLDEIACGTSVAEGSALIAAILDYLSSEICCQSVASVHAPEILDVLKREKVPVTGWVFQTTICSQDNPDANPYPSYTLASGTSNSSYAIRCAEKAGLPRSMIDQALEKLGDH